MSEPIYRLDDPLHAEQARDAARTMASLRRRAEQDLEAAVREAAQAEHDYRKALAKAFVVADEATAAAREAGARAAVAEQALRRDITAGLVKVCMERLRGLEGERAMLRQLIAWSQSQEERALPAVREAT